MNNFTAMRERYYNQRPDTRADTNFAHGTRFQAQNGSKKENPDQKALSWEQAVARWDQMEPQETGEAYYDKLVASGFIAGTWTPMICAETQTYATEEQLKEENAGFKDEMSAITCRVRNLELGSSSTGIWTSAIATSLAGYDKDSMTDRTIWLYTKLSKKDIKYIWTK